MPHRTIFSRVTQSALISSNSNPSTSSSSSSSSSAATPCKVGQYLIQVKPIGHQIRHSTNLSKAPRLQLQANSSSCNQTKAAAASPSSAPTRPLTSIPRSTFLPYLPPTNSNYQYNPSNTSTESYDLPPAFQPPPVPSCSHSHQMPASTNPHCAPILQALLKRNEGWADQTKADKPELLDSCSKGQAPKVLWIGCSDSRVPESMVTQSQPGEVFVTRNIANQFNPNDDNVVSVLTYAVEALGVEHVVIVGHESCGGVAAALAAGRAAGQAAPPSPQGALQRHLSPLVALAQSVLLDPSSEGLSDAELVQKITEASVVNQMKNVANTDVLERNWKGEVSPLSGKVMERVSVHGWIHDINTGKLRDLNVSLVPSVEAQ